MVAVALTGVDGPPDSGFGCPGAPLRSCAALILLLLVLFRLAGAVRRRIAAVALPVVVLHLVAGYGFADYLYSAHQVVPPIPLGTGQWLLLVLTPIGTLVTTIVLLHWYEGHRRPDLIQHTG